jgi:hypothetical protein
LPRSADIITEREGSFTTMENNDYKERTFRLHSPVPNDPRVIALDVCNKGVGLAVGGGSERTVCQRHAAASAVKKIFNDTLLEGNHHINLNLKLNPTPY